MSIHVVYTIGLIILATLNACFLCVRHLSDFYTCLVLAGESWISSVQRKQSSCGPRRSMILKPVRRSSRCRAAIGGLPSVFLM